MKSITPIQHEKGLRVRFTDHGQDFLEWIIAPDGQVRHCTPFQASVWTKVKVINFNELKEGAIVHYIGQDKQEYCIKYPLESVETYMITNRRLFTQLEIGDQFTDFFNNVAYKKISKSKAKPVRAIKDAFQYIVDRNQAVTFGVNRTLFKL